MRYICCGRKGGRKVERQHKGRRRKEKSTNTTDCTTFQECAFVFSSPSSPDRFCYFGLLTSYSLGFGEGYTRINTASMLTHRIAESWSEYKGTACLPLGVSAAASHTQSDPQSGTAEDAITPSLVSFPRIMIVLPIFRLQTWKWRRPGSFWRATLGTG